MPPSLTWHPLCASLYRWHSRAKEEACFSIHRVQQHSESRATSRCASYLASKANSGMAIWTSELRLPSAASFTERLQGVSIIALLWPTHCTLAFSQEALPCQFTLCKAAGEQGHHTLSSLSKDHPQVPFYYPHGHCLSLVWPWWHMQLLVITPRGRRPTQEQDFDIRCRSRPRKTETSSSPVPFLDLGLGVGDPAQGERICDL